MSSVSTIIDHALLVAQNKTNLADAYTGSAISYAGGFSRFSPGAVADNGVDEPNVYIPSRVSGIDTALFDSMYADIVEDLSNRFRDFIIEFFPISPSLMPSVEAWLESAIAGGTGINTTVEQKIWHRARDRISSESASASEQALNQWASRGYPLPPGAANASIAAIAQRKTEQVANVSREAAIKAFDTEIENVRFAISQAIDYRTRSIAAAGDYIRALAVAPDIASKMSTQSADAQARLISAVSGYYNARNNAAELSAKIGMFNVDKQVEAALSNQNSDAKYTEMRVGAAMAAAQSVGQQASAALNGLNATSQLIESVG